MASNKRTHAIVSGSFRKEKVYFEAPKWFLETLIKSIENSEFVINKTLMISNFWKYNFKTNLSQCQKKVIQKVLDHEPEGFLGGMINQKYVNITKSSRETAKRELLDLVEKKILVKI